MLLLKKFLKTLTLDDLPSFTATPKSLRSEASILIIDDKEFVYEEGLRNSRFNITVHDKWNSITDVEPYSIIISDNQGVVDRADRSDGLTMVNEARKIYPEKKFALYSGNLLDIRDRKFDGLPIRTKGDDLEAWISMLDSLIIDCYNPKKQWENISLQLGTVNIRVYS